MTQDVLFARSSAEKPAQIPEECFCRETTVLCDVPDPYVHVLLLPGVHRSLTHPTSLTLRPPRKHMGHGPTVSHENSSWSKQCALKNCNRIEKNQNEPLKETWKLSCAICFIKIQMHVWREFPMYLLVKMQNVGIPGGPVVRSNGDSGALTAGDPGSITGQGTKIL